MAKDDDFISGWQAAYKIGKAVTSNFNLEEVLSMVGKIACNVTKSEAASIILVNAFGNNIYIGGSFGIDRVVALEGPLGFERTMLQHLASSKRPLWIGNVKENPRFNQQGLLNGFLSALCAPVIFNKRFLAAIVLYSARHKVYTKAHIKVISALSYQVALLLQNYHLYTNTHLNYFNTIKSLVLAMEARDPYTKGHSERVTEYALVIANEMGLRPEQVQMIKYCGALHDVGKIAISDTILNKKGSLTRAERMQIERHPVEGAAVISPLTFLRDGVSLIKYHHERFDGSGYPDGLKGDRIPVTARILACADAYDAMTSERAYKRRLTNQQAIVELRNNAGTQFDPQVTDVFIKSLQTSQERI
jgi:HD-GYP domain-containing protein (c-di-GMP phosphodiesterase class II)